MNESERYVFAIYQIAMEVRETLSYFLVAEGQRHEYKRYETRGNVIKTMIAPQTPFDLWCTQNGEMGEKVREKVTNFYNEIYGPEATILKVREENGEKYIYVEEALYNDFIDQCVGIKETFNDILRGFINYLKEQNQLEDDFERMLKLDERYYRSFAFKVLSILINTKFMEFNKACRDYVNANRDNPDGYKDDPSVQFVGRELSQLFNLAGFVAQHSIEQDQEFKDTMNQYLESFKVFTGETKVDNLQEFFKTFSDIFNKLLIESQTSYMRVFQNVYNELVEFEKNLKREETNKETK